MDALLPSPALAKAVAPPALPEARSRSAVLGVLAGLARGSKCWLLAALSCLSIPFAIVFSGWTCRLVQRRALAWWARRLGSPQPGRLLPRWVVSDALRDDVDAVSHGPLSSRCRAGVRAGFGSLAANFKVGFLVVLNSMLVTLPSGLIMLFSWYAGWNNSFNKGYEQAQVGPLLGLGGIALLVAAMTYLPIAQARQAVTGSAKAFWNYRRVRDVIARRPLACLLLVTGYAILGLGFMVAVNALGFVGNSDQFAEMARPEIVAWLHRYYFWWAVLFIVPGFVGLKLLAGRIYAGAAWEAVTEGEWRKDELTGAESMALAGVSVVPSRRTLPAVWRASLGAFSALGRATMAVATFLLLLAFSFQLYVAQFVAYDPANWLRHPLVQLPWYHNIPAHLRE